MDSTSSRAVRPTQRRSPAATRIETSTLSSLQRSRELPPPPLPTAGGSSASGPPLVNPLRQRPPEQQQQQQHSFATLSAAASPVAPTECSPRLLAATSLSSSAVHPTHAAAPPHAQHATNLPQLYSPNSSRGGSCSVLAAGAAQRLEAPSVPQLGRRQRLGPAGSFRSVAESFHEDRISNNLHQNPPRRYCKRRMLDKEGYFNFEEVDDEEEESEQIVDGDAILFARVALTLLQSSAFAIGFDSILLVFAFYVPFMGSEKVSGEGVLLFGGITQLLLALLTGAALQWFQEPSAVRRRSARASLALTCWPLFATLPTALLSSVFQVAPGIALACTFSVALLDSSLLMWALVFLATYSGALVAPDLTLPPPRQQRQSGSTPPNNNNDHHHHDDDEGNGAAAAFFEGVLLSVDLVLRRRRVAKRLLARRILIGAAAKVLLLVTWTVINARKLQQRSSSGSVVSYDGAEYLGVSEAPNFALAGAAFATIATLDAAMLLALRLLVPPSAADDEKALLSFSGAEEGLVRIIEGLSRDLQQHEQQQHEQQKQQQQQDYCIIPQLPTVFSQQPQQPCSHFSVEDAPNVRPTHTIFADAERAGEVGRVVAAVQSERVPHSGSCLMSGGGSNWEEGEEEEEDVHRLSVPIFGTAKPTRSVSISPQASTSTHSQQQQQQCTAIPDFSTVSVATRPRSSCPTAACTTTTTRSNAQAAAPGGPSNTQRAATVDHEGGNVRVVSPPQVLTPVAQNTKRIGGASDELHRYVAEQQRLLHDPTRPPPLSATFSSSLGTLPVGLLDLHSVDSGADRPPTTPRSPGASALLEGAERSPVVGTESNDAPRHSLVSMLDAEDNDQHHRLPTFVQESARPRWTTASASATAAAARDAGIAGAVPVAASEGGTDEVDSAAESQGNRTPRIALRGRSASGRPIEWQQQVEATDNASQRRHQHQSRVQASCCTSAPALLAVSPVDGSTTTATTNAAASSGELSTRNVRSLTGKPRHHGGSRAPSPVESVASSARSTSSFCTRSLTMMNRQQRRSRLENGVKDSEEFEYRLGPQIGSGATSKVFRALMLESGETVAVKVLQLEPGMRGLDVKLAAIKKEIEILKMLESDFIVKYLFSTVKRADAGGRGGGGGARFAASNGNSDGHQQQQQRSDEMSLHIVTEYISGGSLADVIKEQGRLEERTAAAYAAQILLGIEYLHANKVSHRDLKPLNIFVAHNGAIKIADFGCSALLSDVSSGAGDDDPSTATGAVAATVEHVASAGPSLHSRGEVPQSRQDEAGSPPIEACSGGGSSHSSGAEQQQQRHPGGVGNRSNVGADPADDAGGSATPTEAAAAPRSAPLLAPHASLPAPLLAIEKSASEQQQPLPLRRISAATPGSASSDRATARSNSASSGMVGTPQYMSPELVRGELSDASPMRLLFAADIWSFGATLMTMLTGEPPFSHISTQVFGVMHYLADDTRPVVLPPAITDHLVAAHSTLGLSSWSECVLSGTNTGQANNNNAASSSGGGGGATPVVPSTGPQPMRSPRQHPGGSGGGGSVTSQNPSNRSLSSSQRPPQYSHELIDILTSCLDRDPAARPTAAELCGHPWFATRGLIRTDSACNNNNNNNNSGVFSGLHISVAGSGGVSFAGGSQGVALADTTAVLLGNPGTPTVRSRRSNRFLPQQVGRTNGSARHHIPTVPMTQQRTPLGD